MRTPRLIAAATIAATTFVVAPLAASAATTDPSTESTTDAAELQARLDRACARIPNLTLRTENVLDRIQGDADTRGSLLWLDTKIEQANTEGREQLVEVLTNRRAVREASIPLLEQRLVTLAEIDAICAS
ncbi:MAG: hypothetical protein AAGG08_16855 [Actinomycetota bacterium]